MLVPGPLLPGLFPEDYPLGAREFIERGGSRWVPNTPSLSLTRDPRVPDDAQILGTRAAGVVIDAISEIRGFLQLKGKIQEPCTSKNQRAH